jgi:hypothetical protein
MIAGMGKRLMIGIAWWLAVAYFWQFGAALWGFPSAAGPIVALAVAWLVAADPVGAWIRSRRPQLRRYPADAIPSRTPGGKTPAVNPNP